MGKELNLNKKKTIILLIFIYLFGVAVYFFLGCFSKSIDFLPDERYYIQAAKSIGTGNGLYYNGARSTFQKILYSIIISPAFLVKDLHLQIRLACLLGTLFELSSIFPVFLICRKLNIDRIKSLLLCVFSLSVPTFLFSMTFMSETTFLPLWIWIVYLVLIMLDSADIKMVVPILLGIIAYFLYMCKEVGIVAIPSLFLTKTYLLIRKRDNIKGIIPCVISGLVFGILFLLGKVFIFNGKASSYSYELSAPKNTQYGDKNPAYYFLLYLFFYLAYMILVNNIFPIFVRPREYNTNHKIMMYIEIATIMLVFIVVYRISLSEDYGLLSPRLHFRYFEPLFIPYTICFIARLNENIEETTLDNKYTKFAFGIFLFVLMLLPAINAGGSLDSTTYMFYLIPDRIATSVFLGSPRKTVILNIVMKLLILVTVLLEVKLLRRSKKWFATVFLLLAFVINIAGLYLKYVDLKFLYKMPEKYLIEMQTINNELDGLRGDKLYIVREKGRLSEIVTTYYDINNTDLYLADEDYQPSDKNISLKTVNTIREVCVDDYDYVIYSNDIWEDSQLKNISSNKTILATENFRIIEN